ncbi:hypothetical protein IFM89_014338 [Coptis chinensis]|uniref:IMP dehydrogenase/GMP reductase domain-containing protein n=1 Tax=Coptis chinensis TaxID=261450 RepID=A0A835HQQ2_9MAGN|nr:hypothetical protein IFM89_014338 [Coptis chinensis]
MIFLDMPFFNQGGHRVKKYRGMGSLETMKKGSDAWYLGDTSKLKVAQGVVGAVADKGSVLTFIPYSMQAIKQGFQDLSAPSVELAHKLFTVKCTTARGPVPFLLIDKLLSIVLLL